MLRLANYSQGFFYLDIWPDVTPDVRYSLCFYLLINLEAVR